MILIKMILELHVKNSSELNCSSFKIYSNKKAVSLLETAFLFNILKIYFSKLPLTKRQIFNLFSAFRASGKKASG